MTTVARLVARALPIAMLVLAAACSGGRLARRLSGDGRAAQGSGGSRAVRHRYQRDDLHPTDPRRAASTKTQLWYPTDAAPDATAAPNATPARYGHFPIVILSHGSGGEPQFHQYLTQHLASWRYVVAAPEHTGNTLADCFLCGAQNIIASAGRRPDDVTFVLDQVTALKDDPAQPLGAVLDTERTAIAGHSFGGWTAIYTAPGGRFDAAIALAPGLPGSLLARATMVHIPTLLIAGSDDEVVPVNGVAEVFAALPPETAKTYVTLTGGRHLAFIDDCLDCTVALSAARGHDLINGYVTAFLQVYLAGDQRYAGYLTESQPDVVVAAR